jgi:ABC-type polar amino acid transport system ATPase subunit
MGGFIDRYPNETSLGERQRAAIARAVILQPSYILLDEITSALDVEQVNAILRLLKALRENGIGILLVTHLLEFARQTADRVVFLEEGKVLESGGREVLASPISERIRQFLSVIEAAR